MKDTNVNIGAKLFWIFVVIAVGLHLVHAQSSPAEQSKPAYLNPSLSVEERVNDLVSRMTIEEKISQMQNNAPAIPRLGIPAYGWANEAVHGVALAGHATVFPQAIGTGELPVSSSACLTLTLQSAGKAK